MGLDKEGFGGWGFPLNKFVHKILPKEMIDVFIEGLLQRDVWISISDFFT